MCHGPASIHDVWRIEMLDCQEPQEDVTDYVVSIDCEFVSSEDVIKHSHHISQLFGSDIVFCTPAQSITPWLLGAPSAPQIMMVILLQFNQRNCRDDFHSWRHTYGAVELYRASLAGGSLLGCKHHLATSANLAQISEYLFLVVLLVPLSLPNTSRF